MLTVTVILVVAALIAAIVSAMAPPRCPLWVSVILLCVAFAIQVLPK